MRASATLLLALSVVSGAVAQTRAPVQKAPVGKRTNPPVAGRWYRETDSGRTSETLQIEEKGGVVYTREMGTERVKSYGTWKRTGTTLKIKLPIKDLRKNDEAGLVLRIESSRLVPTVGDAWVRARKNPTVAFVPVAGGYTTRVDRPGGSAIYSLELLPDGAVVLVASPTGGTEEEFGGAWKIVGRTIEVKLAEREVMVFTRNGTSLQPSKWDLELFGDTAPRFLRKPR